MPQPPPTVTQRNHWVRTAWIHDAFYLLASLLVWNWRKTLFRLGNPQKKCPCQSLSDSGQPGESRCEASLSLNDPARFVWICPALIRTPVGLRCRHARAEVRPYWSRAFGVALATILLGYMTLSTAWFGVLRNRGFDQVGWTDCIWPGNWPNIATARGAYFYKQAQQALRQNDIALAMRLLSSGYATCPQCWAQGLLLARLFEHVGQFAAADQLFTNLSQRFPEQREIIELNHHDALLASQRFFGLNRLAWLNIRSDRPSAGSWIVPLLLTARERPNWETLWETHTAEISDLTPEQQTLLSIVVPPAHLDEAQQVEQALKVPSGSALTARLRWELLLRYTGRSAALRSITQDAAQFNAFEYALARWATLAPAVSAKVRAQLWDQVITPPLQSLQVERICAVILANSYPTPLYQLRSRIADDDRSSLAAIWVVASVQGDEALARSVCAGLGLDPDDIQNQLTLTNARHSLPALASIIPIPREVLYALIHRTGSTAKAP